MQRKTILTTVLVYLTIMMSFSLTSCQDNTLAKAMDGTWKGHITTHYDDQSIENEDIYIQFDYMESNEKDGGTYIEVRDCNAKDIDLDDTKLDVHYTTYIEGEWEVLAGTLSMKPDVSTLKVNVHPNDVKQNYQSVSAVLDNIADVMDIFGESTRGLVTAIQKQLYTNLFHEYKSEENNAEDEFFDDLDVNENAITFTTGDVGKTTLKKANVNVQDIYGSHLSK